MEGLSVNGKTSGAGDGFSDGNPLGAADIDPVGEVEGVKVRAILGDSVGSDDDDSDVDEGDGLTITTDDANMVGSSVGDSEDEHQGTVV